METRDNTEVLAELVALDGKEVVDVGCGEGSLVRAMTRAGARVKGVECGARQLEKARAAAPVGGESYLEGVGEDLPLEDGSADVVVFFNSLHHVPEAQQATALAEAVRVLRPGGLVYVAEPLAEGPQFELVRPVHDETAVRAHAYRVIQEAEAVGLKQETEVTYVHPLRHKSFEAYRDRMLSINPDKQGAFEAMDSELRERYRRLGRPGEGGDLFPQPIRVNLLRKS
jgi:2-polyprenyl-3-methyl-5-hydroxy-6-metoxy-1,4-benzoquinol methylase